MDYKKMLNELDNIHRTCNSLAEKITEERSKEYEQKSKKTRKKNEYFDCIYRALYATRKYGCTGFIAMTECSVCEFRR